MSILKLLRNNHILINQSTAPITSLMTSNLTCLNIRFDGKGTDMEVAMVRKTHPSLLAKANI